MADKKGHTENLVDQIARTGGLAVVMYLGALALIPLLGPIVPDFGESALGDLTTFVFLLVVLFGPAYAVLSFYHYRKIMAE